MQRRSFVAGTALLAASLAANSAFAQGSSVYTQSACASGRAVTAVASPCEDGSAILYNPAALALQPGALGLGVTGIWSTHTFEYDFTGQRVERDPATVPVPQGYLTARLGDRVGLGVGVFAPYGGSIEWPEEFEGRFVTRQQTLRSIYIQPTVSYAIVPGQFSVGGGVDIVRASIDLFQRADLADVALAPGLTFGNFGVPRGTDFAEVNLAGSGTGTGWHVGALMQPTPWLSVGARYMSRVTTDLEGDAAFRPIATGLVIPQGSPLTAVTQVPAGQPVEAILTPAFQAGGPLAAQGVETSITWPDQAVLGVAVRPFRALQLLVDYHWFGWSSFDRFPVNFTGAGQDTELVLNYQNAEAWRFGAEFGARDGLQLRAGYIYNTAASPEGSVSPFLPEGERNYYTAGLGYRFPMGLQADVFYQFVDQDARRGRVRTPAPGQNPVAANIGVYTLDAHVFGVSFALQPRFLAR